MRSPDRRTAWIVTAVGGIAFVVIAAVLVPWQPVPGGTPPPVAVGSLMDFEARFLGRRLAYTYEVVDLDPGRRLTMRTADGPFPMETTYTWEPVAGGTLMKLRNRGAPSGFARVAAPMMAKAMRGAMTKDLARLAQRLTER